VSVSSRTMPASRLDSGAVVALLIVAVLAVFGVGTVASAEPAQQAATATPAGAGQTCTSTQGIQLSLANPQPGDTLLSGVPINISGIAYDAASNSGSGIASVMVYLGDRNAGGLSLGTALLGQPNPEAPAGSQFANAGFRVRTPSLPTGSGARTLFVYARSAITNAERILQVPVFLNSAPTPVRGQVPTTVLTAAPACTPTPVPTAIPTAAPAAAAAAATAAPTVVFAPTLAALPTLALPAPAPAAAPAAPAAPAPAAPAPAPATPAAAAPAVAPATAAQTTAPRGGGIPSELGLALVTAGAVVLAGGMALRRRQRSRASES